MSRFLFNVLLWWRLITWPVTRIRGDAVFPSKIPFENVGGMQEGICRSRSAQPLI